MSVSGYKNKTMVTKSGFRDMRKKTEMDIWAARARKAAKRYGVEKRKRQRQEAAAKKQQE